ncbi:MAG: SpoIID/LytB domain-containing protein [Firmicutes bacterium]|nr:SpoIID/LytB domain-containing protein [[Eubacterium] siraeum]MCM1487280.1 SpoIID/LytB domain-containing protein [Bacillota bacterium]
MKKYLAMAIIAAFAVFLLPKGFNAVFSGRPPEKAQEEFTLILISEDKTVTIPAEDYIVGCLFAQIDVSYELEALKAQAAAAYTYALRLIENGEELSDSVSYCQPYFTPKKAKEYYGDSYEKYLPVLKEAAEYGANHPIYYENKPIYSVYHSVSAGATNRPEYVWGLSLPYLQRKDCPKDKEYKGFSAENEITPEEVRQRLFAYDPTLEMPVDYSLWFTDTVKDENGYVTSAKIGEKTVSGGDLWRILKLRSAAFNIVWTGMNFNIATKGCGHGVGLSQFTANEMAKEGKSAEEILTYFYEGAQVVCLS